MFYSYLFEAKSIQSYIFSTNKLKEIIGGSELIEQLTAKEGLLRQTLTTIDLDNTIQLSRCGGAAFYAFSENKDAINRLANIWPLAFRQYAPDMEFIHAKAGSDTRIKAFQEAHSRLMADRNCPKVKLPQAGVYTQRFARTGEPVAQTIRVGKDTENVDQITARKRDFANSEALVRRVAKTSQRDDWPVNLTPEDDDGKDFPFNDNRLIGLIHADGNGFGQLLMDLNENVGKGKIKDDQYIDVFHDISESIKQATEAAAEQAVEQTLTMERGLYPARPIVLGGDDLTMIVRADLALPFTQAFLTAFERESQMQFNQLRKNHPNLQGILPQKLTACAGIVYAKSSQPFSALHDLAEDLCKHAKKISKQDNNLLDNKQVPSSLSFYRVTSTLLDDFSDVLKHELTAQQICMSCGCYALEPHSRLPNLGDLLKLQAFLAQSEVSQGALRQITGLMHQSPEQAQSRYRRWKEVMQERNAQQWQAFDKLRRALSEPKTDGFDVNQTQAVPFEDVLSLSAVGNVLNPVTEAQA